EVEPHPHRHTDRRGHPKARRRGQPSHVRTVAEDRPTADEADPDDDLTRHPREVRLDPVRIAPPRIRLKPERPHYREQTRTERNEDVRPEPRGLILELPLEPDHPTERRRNQYPNEHRPVGHSGCSLGLAPHGKAKRPAPVLGVWAPETRRANNQRTGPPHATAYFDA